MIHRYDLGIAADFRRGCGCMRGCGRWFGMARGVCDSGGCRLIPRSLARRRLELLARYGERSEACPPARRIEGLRTPRRRAQPTDSRKKLNNGAPPTRPLGPPNALPDRSAAPRDRAEAAKPTGHAARPRNGGGALPQRIFERNAPAPSRMRGPGCPRRVRQRRRGAGRALAARAPAGRASLPFRGGSPPFLRARAETHRRVPPRLTSSRRNRSRSSRRPSPSSTRTVMAPSPPRSSAPSCAPSARTRRRRSSRT